MSLVQAVLNGERLALARLITQVENGTAEGQSALDELFAHTGRAHLVGVTGSPGTGKSSLVNQIAHHFRRETGGRVAIVAVDPSSPFTGGAILGDRVRMRDLSGDPGVFIRSMAARGALGGLARTTAAVVQVLDAAGYDWVLIETVGAGQSEVDIARLAHTTLVVEAPGMGDDIQAIKAGILEIADILVVNKADRPGVEATERALRNMLELRYGDRLTNGEDSQPFGSPAVRDASDAPETWVPPVYRTIAPQGNGVEQVVQSIRQHAEFLHRSGQWKDRERARLQNELETLVQATLVARWRAGLPDEVYQSTVASLFDRRVSPFQAVNHLLYENTPGAASVSPERGRKINAVP